MIERFVYTLLKNNLPVLLGDPDLLRAVLTDQPFFLEGEDVDEILALLITGPDAKPLNIIHGYPRADLDFPQLAVFIGEESESQLYAGNYAGPVPPEVAAVIGVGYEGVAQVGAVWQHRVIVRACTLKNPDVADYYYQLAKLVLTRDRVLFAQNGVMNPTFSGSGPGQERGFMPEIVFSRQLTISCKSELRIAEQFGKNAARIANQIVQVADPTEGDVDVHVVASSAGESS